MSGWLSANEDNSYPFEDGFGYQGEARRVVDGSVLLPEPGRAFLRILSTGTSPRIVIDSDTQPGVIDTTSLTITPFGEFMLVSAGGASARVSLTIRDPLTDISINDTLPFATQALHFPVTGVRSINGDTGPSVRVKFSDAFNVEVNGQLVTLSRRPASELITYPADEGIRTINDVAPNGSANFQLLEGNQCHQIRQTALGIFYLDNSCRVCCSCNEFYQSYVALRNLDDEVVVDINNVVALINRYNALVRRFEVFKAQPTTSGAPVPPAPGETIARTWAGGNNEFDSLAATLRFMSGSYGGALAILINNGIQARITRLIVDVTTSQPMTPGQGQIQSTTRANQWEPFEGFPGSVTRDLVLTPRASIMLSSDMYAPGISQVSIGATIQATFDRDVTTGPTPRQLSLSLGVRDVAVGASKSLTGQNNASGGTV